MIKTIDFTGIEVGREVVLSNGYKASVIYVDDNEFAVQVIRQWKVNRSLNLV